MHYKIYDDLNIFSSKNIHNRTWRILKNALKKYPDNPIFLYYKALELYRTKNFDYADNCISSVIFNAKKYGLSDYFIGDCNFLLNFEETRNNVYNRKIEKRSGRLRYKNSKFCGNCGSSLTSPCPNCGASVALDTKFCGECGTKMD